jgi:glycosyltransferase involved in cell wall biosynthesis
VAKKADHCFTPHYLLRDKLLKVNKNVKMLFHAHSYEQNKNVGVGKKDRLIKVAFAGYIHYRLIDHWLEHLLEEKNIELYLIGPLNPQYSICELSKKQNFHFVPPLMANDLQRTLQEMNVLIIPYHPHLPETEVLTTVSKLYQYIASGKPVVLSNLPNFIEMPEGVLYKASSSENFVAKILQAHAEDCEEYRNLRAKIAAENTWDKRGEQLHALLKETLGDKIPELSQNAN